MTAEFASLFWSKPNLLLSNLILDVSENPIIGDHLKFEIWIALPILIGTLWFSTSFVVLGFNTSRDVEEFLLTS